MKATRHPLFIITDPFTSSRLKPGMRLRLLPHNAIIRPTDFMNAVENPPNRGLMPVITHGHRPRDRRDLVYYRLIA